VAGVQLAPVAERGLAETIEANAESGYDMTRYAQVSARVPGFAVQVRVKAGQQVKKAEVLCLVDSPEVGKAKADLLQSAATLASKRAALERIKSSTEAGFRNQADLAAAEAEVKEAGIRLFNARQALKSLGLSVPDSVLREVPSEKDVQFLGLSQDAIASLDPERATANLLPVTAPLDGVVVSQSVVAGETVDAARPLFAIADISRMWIAAEVSPADSSKVEVGQEVTFRPDGGESVSGKVSWISTEVNEKTRTVQVRAEVPNPKGRLRARMFGRASITIAKEQSAIAVPSAAVQKDGADSVVFVRLNDEVFRPRVVTLGLHTDGFVRLNDEVFRPRVVTLGLHTDGFVQVLKGLNPGETIATQGSYFLAAQANRAKLGAGCCAND
jgi:cobalt-zinc-cadmium efflux system membrane fusion protein